MRYFPCALCTEPSPCFSRYNERSRNIGSEETADFTSWAKFVNEDQIETSKYRVTVISDDDALNPRSLWCPCNKNLLRTWALVVRRFEVCDIGGDLPGTCLLGNWFVTDYRQSGIQHLACCNACLCPPDLVIPFKPNPAVCIWTISVLYRSLFCTNQRFYFKIAKSPWPCLVIFPWLIQQAHASAKVH